MGRKGLQRLQQGSGTADVTVDRERERERERETRKGKGKKSNAVTTTTTRTKKEYSTQEILVELPCEQSLPPFSPAPTAACTEQEYPADTDPHRRTL
jgi:hypothetical protein